MALTLTTWRTPGMPLTLSASKLTILDPNTGESSMAALSMPGSLTSMAKIFFPFSLSAVSSRLRGLPTIFQSFGV